MTPTLLFIHGWGFGPGIWDGLRARLAGLPAVAADLGYFGPQDMPRPDGPVILIGHSIGALLALRDAPANAIALVAINGFDHFLGVEGEPGVDPRMYQRLSARLDENPALAIAEFRARCGNRSPIGEPDAQRLREHLDLLRTADIREATAAWPHPLLHLSGDRDPILPAGLREAVFSRAARLVHRRHKEAGHLLPASHPDWCAEQLRELAAGL